MIRRVLLKLSVFAALTLLCHACTGQSSSERDSFSSPLELSFQYNTALPSLDVDLHLVESIANDPIMRPYHIAAAGVCLGTFVCNWCIIENQFGKAPPGTYVNARRQTLPVYIAGISISASIILVGHIRVKNKRARKQNFLSYGGY